MNESSWTPSAEVLIFKTLQPEISKKKYLGGNSEWILQESDTETLCYLRWLRHHDWNSNAHGIFYCFPVFSIPHVVWWSHVICSGQCILLLRTEPMKRLCAILKSFYASGIITLRNTIFSIRAKLKCTVFCSTRRHI